MSTEDDATYEMRSNIRRERCADCRGNAYCYDGLCASCIADNACNDEPPPVCSVLRAMARDAHTINK